MKIVADHKIPFLKGAFDTCAEVVYLPGKSISRTIVKDADALIVRTRTACNRELLEGTQVGCIASATIGYDHIDTEYCERNGIFWTNAPGCNANSVKQYIASALAYIIHKEKKKFPEITLGIIGAGHVGSRVAEMVTKLGMKTLVNDPPRERREGSAGFVSIGQLLGQSDIITMHVPLQKEGPDKTWHMADEAFFSRMKPGSWLINSSRGEVTNTAALIQALEDNHLAGTVIDVWEDEPHISGRLLALAAIATPHIAGYSADGKANGTMMSVRAVSRFFKLGLDNWEPTNMPEPVQPKLNIQCDGLTAEDIFYAMAMHTYDIASDSKTLKQSVETFEKQREDYPVRREPPAHALELINPTPTGMHIANALGFASSTHQPLNSSTKL